MLMLVAQGPWRRQPALGSPSAASDVSPLPGWSWAGGGGVRVVDGLAAWVTLALERRMGGPSQVLLLKVEMVQRLPTPPGHVVPGTRQVRDSAGGARALPTKNPGADTAEDAVGPRQAAGVPASVVPGPHSGP